MDLNPTSRPALGLNRYVGQVAECLGEQVATFDTEVDTDLATAIIVVNSEVPSFPEWLAVLAWDEVNGWGLRVKVNEEGDTIALCYLGGSILPDPGLVRTFLADAVSGKNPGTLDGPGFRRPHDQDDLAGRLSSLA